MFSDSVSISAYIMHSIVIRALLLHVSAIVFVHLQKVRVKVQIRWVRRVLP